jgi:hypothetical protein
MDQAPALGNRVFDDDVHEDAPVVFETRWAMSYLRGPLTRDQIRVLVEPQKLQRMQPPEAGTATLSSPSPAVAPSSGFRSVAQRPVVPPDVPQYFLSGDAKEATKIGAIISRSSAPPMRFVDPKAKVTC